MALSNKDVRYLLNAWALWHVRGGGYPDACTLGRMMQSEGAPVFGPRIPRDVEPGWRVAQIIRAMDEAESAGVGEAIAAVRAIYLRSKKATLIDVAAAMGIPPTRLDERRRVGETYILGWLMAVSPD